VTFRTHLRPFIALAENMLAARHGLRFLYALLERLHKINYLRTLWPFWRCNRDLLAFAFLRLRTEQRHLWYWGALLQQHCAQLLENRPS